VREALVAGADGGIVVREGLIAHGRGEALDYILGERTGRRARAAISAAAATLLLAERPVISVNGNVAALCAREAVLVARALGASIEANTFHGDSGRRRRIAARLESHGARGVLGASRPHRARLRGLDSERGAVDPRRIAVADAVLVALEDGDRADALSRPGARVVAIDLTPPPRTAQIPPTRPARAARLAWGRTTPPRRPLGEPRSAALAGHVGEIRARLGRIADLGR